MLPRIGAFIALIAIAVGCVHVRVYSPFKDVNTMLVDARAPKMMLSSAKAILVIHRRAVEKADGTTEPMSPKLMIIDYVDLRNVRFYDGQMSVGQYATGSVHGREAILIYKPGYEPAWLERRFFGKNYKYPMTLALVPCAPVRGRRLVFDAVTQAFRGEAESCRRAALEKLAEYVK